MIDIIHSENWQFHWNTIFILFYISPPNPRFTPLPIVETRVSRSISLPRFRQIYGNLFAFIMFTFAQCSRVFSSFVKSFHRLYFHFISLYFFPLLFPRSVFHFPFFPLPSLFSPFNLRFYDAFTDLRKKEKYIYKYI